jgi:hypothetical protein
MRCSGLNGSRFRGKKRSEEAWQSVFCYYLDVWIVEHLLNVLKDLRSRGSTWETSDLDKFAAPILEIIAGGSTPTSEDLDPLDRLTGTVKSMRREMDRTINNAAFNDTFDIDIRSVPGEFVFVASRSASANLPGMSGLKFTYLIDEYENLSESQQIYVNTLIREKELPTTFLIGARLPGVRTHETLSADEVNRKGSEYEWIPLEDAYRQDPERYAEFCARLAVRRLKASNSAVQSRQGLEDALRAEPEDAFKRTSLTELGRGLDPLDRPYIVALRKSVADDTHDEALAMRVARLLSVPDNPALEKLMLHRFYQRWRTDKRPTLAAAQAAREFFQPGTSGKLSREATTYIGLWRGDMVAQIYADYKQKVPYVGFDQFVEMSGFLPRNFLMLLKYVARWADFHGQRPFAGDERISSASQLAGVRDANNWFSSDALPSGELGTQCDLAVRRIGSLLQQARYSDKPAEVGYAAFSTNAQGLSAAAAQVLDACASHELLVEVHGRTARNRGARLRKFQLHPMIAPLYGLPTGRRGEMKLDASETAAIFDPSSSPEEFAAAARRRIGPMMAPFVKSVDQREATLFDAD